MDKSQKGLKVDVVLLRPNVHNTTINPKRDWKIISKNIKNIDSLQDKSQKGLKVVLSFASFNKSNPW